MVDLHSHILYGIDDGSKTLEESLEILNNAYTGGVTDIVVTPHFIKDSKYKANNKKKKELLDSLVKELKKNHIPLHLYLGNEVFIDEGLSKLLDKDISTINGSKYLLIELPMGRKYSLIEEVLDELDEVGIIPIIAHPERYLSYYKDYDFFYWLKNRGCYFQSNIGSLFGEYGRKSKKMMKELLKRDLIDFIGSDIHHPHQKFYHYDIKKKLLKIIKDEDRVNDLLEGNAKRILKGEYL